MGAMKKKYMSMIYDDMAIVQEVDTAMDMDIKPAPSGGKALEDHLRNIIETHSNIHKGKKIKVWSEE